jgi:uroporphyrinogen decarboxylase
MSEFLPACRGQQTAYTPIWLMRQAGRYQPEYRAIREKVSFIELCKTPELATEVTLRPVEQLGVDAAIVFADILLVLEPLGIGFTFTDDHGPRIPQPIRTKKAVDAIPQHPDVESELAYVLQTIKLVRKALPSALPLIGFSGAPFTLASYIIEGGSSRDFLQTKKMMFGEPHCWHALMAKLTDAVIHYLNAQCEAGAQALQIFDSWVGCLGPDDYRTYVQPHMTRLFKGIDADAPVIHFATGNVALYPLMKQAGGDVIGLDWRVDLKQQWDQLGPGPVMGNLDPVVLLAPRKEMERRARQLLDSVQGRAGHIFNLGHGILPQTDVDQARALIDVVHEASTR